MTNSTIRRQPHRFVLGLCSLALATASFACDSKKKTPTPASESAEGESAAAPETAPTAEPTAPPAEAPATASAPATEEERKLAEAFIVRFTKIIESGKSDGWLELHTIARREKLESDGMIEQSYMAWVAGTAPVLKEIRTAKFRLEHVASQLELTFDGTMVPNDPSAVYQMHLVVEDGELRIDEL